MGQELPSFKSVAESPILRDLLTRAFRSTVSYDEFMKLPMPEGCTPQDMWDFVMAVMHCSGETRNLRAWRKGIDSDVCWSYETKDMRQDLFRIALLANSGSVLNSYITNSRQDERVMSYAIEEVSHCARYDGLNVSERVVRDIWLKRRDPRTAGERVIANAYRVFSRASRLTGAAAYSRMLIAEIQDTLLEGVDGRAFEHSFTYHWDLDVVNTRLAEDPEYANELLDFEIGLAKNAVDIQDVAKTAAFASTALRDVRFVPQLRNLTEIMLRIVFFTKRQAPLLIYIPATSIFDMRMGDVKNLYISDSVRCPKEGLYTNWMHWGMVKAYREGAEMVAETLKEIEHEGRAKRDVIAKIPSLSLRQRAFLNLAVSQPSRWFRVKEYASLYNIAYATARGELNKLTNRGFLIMRKIGRAYCYQAVAADSHLDRI